MRRLIAIAAICALTVSLFTASTAVAATEFGDNCNANTGTGESMSVTLFALTSPADTLPLAAPSAGVVTGWRLSLFVPEATLPPIIPQTLKVLRVNTGSKTAQVVG